MTKWPPRGRYAVSPVGQRKTAANFTQILQSLSLHQMGMKMNEDPLL